MSVSCLYSDEPAGLPNPGLPEIAGALSDAFGRAVHITNWEIRREHSGMPIITVSFAVADPQLSFGYANSHARAQQQDWAGLTDRIAAAAAQVAALPAPGLPVPTAALPVPTTVVEDDDGQYGFIPESEPEL